MPGPERSGVPEKPEALDVADRLNLPIEQRLSLLQQTNAICCALKAIEKTTDVADHGCKLGVIVDSPSRHHPRRLFLLVSTDAAFESLVGVTKDG